MPAGRSNASSLLQKVNSQLRGERVPIQTKEEDELAIYLQKLSQKTHEVKTVGFEEHGDISISSGADALQTPRGQRTGSPAATALPASSSGSKFLKKRKSESKDEDSDREEKGPGQGIVIQGQKKAAAQASKSSVLHPVRTSALDKASALANKITSRATGGIPLRRRRSGGSESDESVRGSEAGKRPGSADTSIGRDANRFLKSRKIGSDEVRQGTRSPSPQPKYQSGSVEKKETNRRSSKSKGEIVRTLGSVYLTSEEESLADFIHGLSTSETSKRPQNLVAKKQQKWRKKTPSPAGRQSASPIHMSRSASPFKNRSPSPFGRLSRSQSQDSDMMLDSMASEMLDDRQRRDDSVSSDDNKFNINLMDIDSLIPASPSPEPVPKKGSKKSRPRSGNKKSSPITSTSVFNASVPNVFKADRLTDGVGSAGKKSVKAEKSSKSNSNLFESLGIQMADDLFGDMKDDDDRKNASGSDESEIVTEKSQDKRKRLMKADSESEILTDFGNRSRKAVLERQVTLDDSVSEILSERSSLGNIKLAYSSGDEGGSTETGADYSESFISESETAAAASDARSRQRRKARKDSVSRSSKASHRRRHKVVLEEKRVDISAADDKGKTHFWNATQTSVSGPFGLQYVDPTPIATHVVSADALEAMTAYSPNMLALQDMMKAQLQLVTSFMDIQRRIYQSCQDGLQENFQYTTLEDTKQKLCEVDDRRLVWSTTNTTTSSTWLVDLEDGGVTR